LFGPIADPGEHARFLADIALDHARDGFRRPEQADAAGHVDELLVDGIRLHQIAVALENLRDLQRHVDVLLHPRLQHDDAGTFPHRFADPFGRLDAPFFGQRAGRQHDARPLCGIAGDDDRLVPVFGTGRFLHAGVETLHVHQKNDLSVRRFRHRFFASGFRSGRKTGPAAGCGRRAAVSPSGEKWGALPLSVYAHYNANIRSHQ